MIEEDKDGKPVLIIMNNNGRTCFLRQSAPRAWGGRWLAYEQMKVELTPAFQD
jgi:hypothetical protein